MFYLKVAQEWWCHKRKIIDKLAWIGYVVKTSTCNCTDFYQARCIVCTAGISDLQNIISKGENAD